MLLRAIDGRFTGFQGGTVLDHGSGEANFRAIHEVSLGISKRFCHWCEPRARALEPWTPGALCVRHRSSVCRALALSVSGPGGASWSAYKICSIAGICLTTIGFSLQVFAKLRGLRRAPELCVGSRRSLCRAPVLSASYHNALCVGPELCIGALCRAPSLSSLCRGPALSVSALCVENTRRSPGCLSVAARHSLCRPGAFCVGARRFLAPYVRARRSLRRGSLSPGALCVALSCSLCRGSALSVSEPGALCVRSLALPGALALCRAGAV